MRRRAEPGRAGPRPVARHPALDGRVGRFDLTERSVHWLTAAAGLTLLATGAVLYVPSLSLAVGRRLLVENLHLFVGLGVLAPVVLVPLTRAGRQLRGDLAAMGRLTRGELSWLRSGGRRGREAVGKFNPGQKLNASAVGGLLVVLLGSGVVLRWGSPLPVGIRTGATFVHDVAAFAFAALVLGHVGFALAHPSALRSMVAGWVPRAWVARHAPAWRPPHPPPGRA